LSDINCKNAAILFSSPFVIFSVYSLDKEWTEFRQICYSEFFTKICFKRRFWWKSEKKISEGQSRKVTRPQASGTRRNRDGNHYKTYQGEKIFATEF
jgi:hypothetical protein